MKGKTSISREYAAESRPEIKKEHKEYEDVVLPAEFRTLTREWRGPWYKSVKKYLFDRGLCEEDFFVYKLGYCESGEYAGRVVMPSFDEHGLLNFFTARTVVGAGLKYKHGSFCKDIIFNDYLVDWNSPVTIVEGPFDAMKAGTNAIPIQGTLLNVGSKLFAKLVERQRLVYLALDSDAEEKTWKIAIDLARYGLSVGIVSIKNTSWKDPGEMTREEFDRLRAGSLVVSDGLSIMKRRMELK